MKYQYNLAYVDDKTSNSEINKLVNSIWNERELTQEWKKFVSLLTGRVIKVLIIETYSYST
jgi:hypothetical protein